MVKFKHFKRDGHEDVCEIFSLFWRDANVLIIFITLRFIHT